MSEIGIAHFNDVKRHNQEATSAAFRLLDQMQNRIVELEHALEDAINSPKGVVPESAQYFWDGQRGRVKRASHTQEQEGEG